MWLSYSEAKVFFFSSYLCCWLQRLFYRSEALLSLLCHVDVIAYAYYSIFVSWMQLMIDPIPRSDWGIFVRSIKTRDHRVIIWVMKQNQRSARNSPLDFLFRNQNSMNLFYGRKKKSLKCTNNSQNKRNRNLEVNFQWVSLDISKDLKNFLRLFLKLKSVPVILINDRTKYYWHKGIFRLLELHGGIN